MAVGGISHKGNGSNGNRGKPYGLMLLLAFGAALLGVMVIHKLRERRIFNLLVKEKDHEIISLQLLLQKEKEHTKEMKRKNEDMKAKIYSIRNQKMELDRRLLEMQSTIESLKDEQKTLESALEEKQREINTDAQSENPQVVALTESLKQREAEIEDLKHRLEYPPVKIWSVSSDDPSRPALNVTDATNKEHSDEIRVSNGKEEGEHTDESRSYDNDVGLTRGKGGDDTSTDLADHESTVNVKHKSEGVQVSFGGAEGKNSSNGTSATIHTAANMSKVGYAFSKGKSMNVEEHKQTKEGNLRQEDSQQRVQQNQQALFKGGAKLEMNDNSKSAGSKGKVKHVRFSSEKGKKWRILARNRLLETTRDRHSNGLESMRHRSFPRDDHVPTNREDGTAFNERKAERDGPKGENKFLKVTNTMDSSLTKLPESRNTEGSGEVLTKERDNGGTDNSTGDNMNKRHEEVQQLERQEINGSRESNSSNNENKYEKSDVLVKVATEHERPEEMEAADTENEIDAAAGYLYKDSFSDSEEYKEETDESEF